MLSLQKNKQMKKYSDWFKVDLHIHTDQKYDEGFDRLKTLDFQKKDDIPYINFQTIIIAINTLVLIKLMKITNFIVLKATLV
jgi:hypothetical protein